jgi:hypothetical protein
MQGEHVYTESIAGGRIISASLCWGKTESGILICFAAVQWFLGAQGGRRLATFAFGETV